MISESKDKRGVHMGRHLLLLRRPHFPFLRPILVAAAANVTLSGDAYITSNAISLTACPSLPTSTSSGIGRAFYAYPIRFLDSKSNATASFLCRFSFSITPTRSKFYPSRDGIAFVIVPDVGGFESSNGYMGLPELTASASKDSFFSVEFDTWFDPMVGDINGNHIGIDVNTVVSLASVDVISRGIEYQDAVKMIRVWAGCSSSTRPPAPILAAEIDLSRQFNEFMTMGFSASNGQGSSAHIVDRWKFKTFGSNQLGIAIVDFEQRDCLMCSSLEDESAKRRHANLVRDGKSRTVEMAVGLGGLAAFVFSLFAFIFVVLFVFVKKRNVVNRRRREGENGRVGANRVPTSLSLAEIRLATMGFNRNRVVGEGASAKIYKGSLSSGGEVAVKRFEKANGIERFLK